MPPDPGPFISEFSAWLDAGHGATMSRSRHLRDVTEFLAWYDVNPQDDIMSAARQFAARPHTERGTDQQAISMRLMAQWLSGG